MTDADAPPSLDQTAPDRVVVYRTRVCPYCVAAARFLREVKGVDVVEVDLSGDYEARMELADWTGQQTVPQIFIGKEHVGGYDDMRALDRRGGLDPLIAAVEAAKG